MSNKREHSRLKWIVVAIFAAPAIGVLAWYTVSFLPHLGELNSLASQGMKVKKASNVAFYPLAVAGETENGIRVHAVRQAYWAIEAEKERADTTRRQLNELLWLLASHIHFSEEEAFGLWVECSISGCGGGLVDASQKYFHKPIETMTEDELAGLVALVRSTSIFAPGSERGKKRKQMILEKYHAGP